MSPAARLGHWLGRLSVGRKLMLIYLLDLTAVIYISSILISEKFIAIDFARKEVAGNAYIGALRDGLADAALQGAGHAPASPGLVARAAAIPAIEHEWGAGMQSAELNARLASGMHRLHGAADDPQAVAEVLETGRALVTRIGNQSNLILDPDLDSYYTMSLVVLRYPELLEIVDGIGTRLVAAGGPSTIAADERTRYLILEGRLDGIVTAIRADHEEAFAASSEALRSAMAPGLAQLEAAVERFRREARALSEGGTAPATLRQAQAALIEDLRLAWATSAVELDRLLESRIAGLYQRMWLHLGTALALLFVILGLVYFVARQISSPLKHLADVTDTVRLTGDHTRRAQWNSSDEIGRLVAGFNGMLAQLDREREVQKELAATARAAEAERALVEATPIPLMVTSVPAHAVLHANAPATDWIEGGATDPWARGLDSAVRARFFQQLADRGAVDEFEVRWLAGRSPGWAVLSARRVTYQGQDAVLTAFAPINHLKLMERRLELWAKVFEASSEGIVIVDAERRILTANQALSRQTGYDLGEIIGERPALLLGGSDDALDPVWTAVAGRGQWQGELSVRRRNGTDYPAWVMVSPVRPSRHDISHYIVTSIDITDRKKSEQRIRFLAQHDVLTELPNRSLCVERLRQAIQQAPRHQQRVAVMFIDLDRFKDINDSLGHHIGDSLLRSVSRRLTDAVRAGDTVSRLGGDEFVVVLSGVQDADEAAHIVDQRLIPLIRQPHQIEGAELHVSCSVGIAMWPEDGGDVDTLMRNADAAMYQAKAAGKDGARFFNAEMTERAQARLALEAQLRRAVEAGDQFELRWQPRVDAASGRLAGAEGLIRWHHPERGLVSPGEFIPVAEETGLIVPIGNWVIGEACRQIAAWRADGFSGHGFSINLSARQLRDRGLADEVRSAVARHGIVPGELELELTESMVMEQAELALSQMHALRALGVRLSIDDFGTGYSSLAYLNRFPIDKLKIDRSFVHDMLGDTTDLAIIKAIIRLGHSLGLRIVAEGVERPDEAALLREAGCDELQGYLFAAPMRAADLPGWTRRETVSRRVEVPAT